MAPHSSVEGVCKCRSWEAHRSLSISGRRGQHVHGVQPRERHRDERRFMPLLEDDQTLNQVNKPRAFISPGRCKAPSCHGHARAALERQWLSEHPRARPASHLGNDGADGAGLHERSLCLARGDAPGCRAAVHRPGSRPAVRLHE